MTPCAVVGLEPGWNCNVHCVMCYYVRDPRLGTKEHKPLEEMCRELDAAKARGCSRMTMVGYGEPTMYPYCLDVIKYAVSIGMAAAMITNGLTGTQFYQKLYDAGMDHVLLSMHDLGESLDRIMDAKDAGKRQVRFLEWLKQTGYPFRVNMTIQKLNYRHLPEVAAAAVDYGARHVVLLGYLPHYVKEHSEFEEIAINPVDSAPYIQRAADLVLSAGRMLTIRYQPLCVLEPRYWPYVVNARYVPFDPWEWDNGHHDHDSEKVWKFALHLGDSVAVKGLPCDPCSLKLHCGGFNRVFLQHYGGSGMKTVSLSQVPAEYHDSLPRRGGLHDLNPANCHCGSFRPETLARQAQAGFPISSAVSSGISLPVIP